MKLVETKTSVLGLSELDDFIGNMETRLSTNESKLNSFLKTKVMNALEEVMNERLIGGTTNDNEISLYRKSNHIEDTENGFIIYNDATISADQYKIRNFTNDKFSIALAFEYGTGVVGTSSYGTSMGYVYNDVSNSKSPSHKRFVDSWYLPKSVYGKSGILSQGYKGFEIYRYLQVKIENEIDNWINEFYEKENNL